MKHDTLTHGSGSVCRIFPLTASPALYTAAPQAAIPVDL